MPKSHLTVKEDPCLEQDELSPTPLMWVRKWMWFILLFGLIGAAIGYATRIGNRPMFTATAQILVSPYSLSVLNYTPATLNLSGDKVVIETQMQMLRSPEMLDHVASAVRDAAPGIDSTVMLPENPALLREFIANTLSIRQMSAAEIIEVSFSAEDPELAALVANEVAARFLQVQRETKVEELEKIGAAVEKRVEASALAAEAADRALAEAQDSGQAKTGHLSTLSREAEVKANLHREMLQRLLEIRELANFPSEDAKLISAAMPPATPSNIRPEIIAVMGFLAFALFGILVAATAGPAGGPTRDWA